MCSQRVPCESLLVPQCSAGLRNRLPDRKVGVGLRLQCRLGLSGLLSFAQLNPRDLGPLFGRQAESDRQTTVTSNLLGAMVEQAACIAT